MECEKFGSCIWGSSKHPCAIACLCVLVHEPPELFRFQGHLQMCDPKGSQGIHDGIGDRGRRAAGAGFANALGPQGVRGARRDGGVDDEARHLGCRGNEVVDEGRRQRSSKDRRLRKLFKGERGLPFTPTEKL